MKLSVERQRQQRIADHANEQAEERRQQAIRDMQNADARKRYLDGLRAEKAEKRKLDALELDKQIEPRKQVLQRQWMADHPGRTATDFDKAAWPHLRQNIVAEIEADALEATKAAVRETLSGALAL